MKLLNPRNLPEAICRAAMPYNEPPSPDKIRVTELIAPPMIRKLRMEHWDEIEENVEDRTWALFGTAFHLLMEKYSPKNSISEERIEIDTETEDGITIKISGTPDLHDGNILWDYKTTSVWSYIFGDKPEWEEQINVYAFLIYVSKEVDIKEAFVLAIFRDWMNSKSLEDQNYPQAPIYKIQIPIWDRQRQIEFIESRIETHLQGTPCNERDRWTRPNKYAVKSKAAKRAIRVLDSLEEAEKYLEDNKDKIKNGYIEERKGEDVRCNSYCNVNKWCDYYNSQNVGIVDE